MFTSQTAIITRLFPVSTSTAKPIQGLTFLFASLYDTVSGTNIQLSKASITYASKSFTDAVGIDLTKPTAINFTPKAFIHTQQVDLSKASITYTPKSFDVLASLLIELSKSGITYTAKSFQHAVGVAFTKAFTITFTAKLFVHTQSIALSKASTITFTPKTFDVQAGTPTIDLTKGYVYFNPKSLSHSQEITDGAGRFGQRYNDVHIYAVIDPVVK